MPKNCGSNWSTCSRKPPHRVAVLPGVDGSSSKKSSTDHRSMGTSRMASRPSCRSSQKRPGSSPPPGKRQPIPMMATGSSRNAWSEALRAVNVGEVAAEGMDEPAGPVVAPRWADAASIVGNPHGRVAGMDRPNQSSRSPTTPTMSSDPRPKDTKGAFVSISSTDNRARSATWVISHWRTAAAAGLASSTGAPRVCSPALATGPSSAGSACAAPSVGSAAAVRPQMCTEFRVPARNISPHADR